MNVLTVKITKNTTATARAVLENVSTIVATTANARISYNIHFPE